MHSLQVGLAAGDPGGPMLQLESEAGGLQSSLRAREWGL